MRYIFIVRYFLLMYVLVGIEAIFPEESTVPQISEEHKAYLKKIVGAVDHEKELIFGQSGSFTGHFKLYGGLIRQGIQAYFDRINREEGGVGGKRLRLVSVEDQGDPVLTEYNVHCLKNEYGIELFIGNMGTRGITKILPTVDRGDLALFFPWGGSDDLRDPSHKFIINGLGYMKPQVSALVDYAFNSLIKKKVAIFYADSGFSSGSVSLLTDELKKFNEQPTAVASYNRFTFDIVPCANKIIETDPKIVFCLATSMPTVKLIRQFFRRGYYGTTFMGIDSTAFVKDILHNTLAHYYFSSAVPDACHDARQICQEFRRDYALVAPEEAFTELALSYYIAAGVIVSAIKQCLISSPDASVLTKERIIEKIELMNAYDLGGFPITFDATNRHAFGTKAFIIAR